MAETDISLASFGADPKRGLEVVDAYEVGGLNGFLSEKTLDMSAKSLGPLLTDITPNKLQSLQKDKAFTDFAKENGGVAKSIGLIKNTFPRSAGNLNSVIDEVGDGNIIEIYNTARRLKSNVSSSVYNNIQQDVFNKTVSFTSGITNVLSPLGDYFCKLNTNGINGNGFDLDKAIQAALDGAIGAISALNMCGFDTVGYIDDLNVDDTLRVVIGKTIITDSAENGVLDSVSNLTVRLDSSLDVSERASLADNLVGSFTPGLSTLPDEGTVLIDTLTDLVPGFSVNGSRDRMSLLTKMKPETLSVIGQNDLYKSDVAIASMVCDRVGDPNGTLAAQYPLLTA